MSQPAVSSTGLITGEAVVLDLRPARVGSRSVAAAVDFALSIFAFSMLGAAVGAFSGADPRFVRALVIVGLVLFLVGYPVISLTYFHGRTLGKNMMGIRVVRTDGGTVRVRHATVRTVIGLLELPLGLGLLASLCSRTGRRLGDMFAGTAVVHDRIPLLGRQVLVMPPPLVNWALSADLNGVDERLATDVRSFLGRAPLLRVERRWDVSAAFANAVVAKVTPPPPAGAPPEHVLHAVMAELQRRRVLRSAMYAPSGYGAPSGQPVQGWTANRSAYAPYVDGRPTAAPAAGYYPEPPRATSSPAAPPAMGNAGGFTLPG
jgi:uncharacterized RDD family membrane protein YckC